MHASDERCITTKSIENNVMSQSRRPLEKGFGSKSSHRPRATQGTRALMQCHGNVSRCVGWSKTIYRTCVRMLWEQDVDVPCLTRAGSHAALACGENRDLVCSGRGAARERHHQHAAAGSLHVFMLAVRARSRKCCVTMLFRCSAPPLLSAKALLAATRRKAANASCPSPCLASSLA